MIERFLKCLAILVLYIPRLIGLKIMEWYYSGPNNALPPISEDCLLMSAVTLASRIRTGKTKSVQAVKASIRRIESINNITNCVIAKRFEDAIKEAEAVDAFIATQSKTVEQIEKDTPFLGVPLSVKENVGVKNMPLTLGAVDRKEIVAKDDAQVVKLMKKAGAIPIAVTNNSEMCIWWESKNKVFGTTRNPYHSNHSPGGSSGGEGAIIGGGASPMGIGSDIYGSIRIPSHMCGIFGHKGSPFLVPYETEYPDLVTEQQKRLNVRGPMAKFATDLKAMFKVMTQDAAEDLKLDEPVDIKKLRYFYMDNDGDNNFFKIKENVHPETQTAMTKVVEYFKKAHGITAEKLNLKEVKNVRDIWFARYATEKGPTIFPGHSLVGCVWQTIKAAVGLSQHTVEYCIMGIIERCCTPVYGSAKHSHLLAEGEKLESKFKDLLKDDGVFLYPIQETPPIVLNTSIFRPANFTYTILFNTTGMPSTAFPVMQTEKGLPVGIQVAAAPYQDRLTLAVAEEMEKAFGGWRPPPSKLQY